MARQLKTTTDLRRYLANIINRVEAGTLDPSKAGRLGYLVNITKSVIDGSELEERVEKLEAILKEKAR